MTIEDADVTLGIDLAAQPAGTSACELAWSNAGVKALTLAGGLDDQALTTLRKGASTVAIDAPFGWPLSYVTALSEWRADRRWPDAGRQQLRYRATDLFVQECTGIWPLSPSSDRIAVCAWRCVALLAVWGVQDLLGGDGIVEVYPAAALRCWGLPWRGYKANAPQARARTAAVRAQLILELRRTCPWLVLAEVQWHACQESHDVLDALICSLVARAAALATTTPPAPAIAPRAALEGWIHLPDRMPLSELWRPG